MEGSLFLLRSESHRVPHYLVSCCSRGKATNLSVGKARFEDFLYRLIWWRSAYFSHLFLKYTILDSALDCSVGFAGLLL